METYENKETQEAPIDEKYILKAADPNDPYSVPKIDIPRLLEDTYKMMLLESESRERSLHR